MKKLFLAALIFGVLLCPLAGSARAEKLDFSKLTCGDFLNLDENETTMLYFWLDGYLSAKSGNTVLDTDSVESDLTQLIGLCKKDNNATILSLF